MAVITKLDMVELGTNATGLLSGREYPVKLGIVGIRNRSQKDMAEGIVSLA